MQVVIFAGGLGTRLGELTKTIPKPAVDIGGMPIIHHIMNIYSQYGHNDFIIALGYKSHVIKNYFLNLKKMQSDLEIDFKSNNIGYLKSNYMDWNIKLVETGLDTGTGGRLMRLEQYLDERFLLTYGDGLSNVNINAAITTHITNNAILTMTTIRPDSKYGEIKMEHDQVTSFTEKPKLSKTWVNGGFFVCEKKILDSIYQSEEMLEEGPMRRICRLGQLYAHKHFGFWQCMDTLKDKENLDLHLKSGSIPWLEKAND
jgi:glucose-1-phosphate cytidylyltransferase